MSPNTLPPSDSPANPHDPRSQATEDPKRPPLPDAPPQALHRLLVVLLALGMLGTTALVALSVLRQRVHKPAPGQVYPGGGPDSAGPDLRAGVEPGQGDGRLPRVRPLPAFNLVDEQGRPVTPGALLGRVCVANFIFTHCAGQCPVVTAQMADLQETLKARAGWDRVRLLSFSVDPTRDTPAVLGDYAKMWKAEPGHWMFLTGERAAVESLVRDGFKLVLGEQPKNEKEPILHSPVFVLVDQAGVIRGFYHLAARSLPDGSTLPSDRERLLADVATLLAEKP